MSTASGTRAGPEGERDEMVQLTHIERLVQVASGSFDQRLGLLLGVPDGGHHEDWRLHAKVADALQQVEALYPGPGVAHAWHDHVQQDEIELLPSQYVVSVDNGIRRGDLVRVPVLEAGKDVSQQRDQDRLVVDDQDALRHEAGKDFA